MTISYPRALPFECRFVQNRFQLNDVSAMGATRAGGVLGIELSDPYWTWDAGTKPETAGDRAQWQAWFASLRRVRTFYAWDPDKKYPRYYRAAVLALTRFGGGSFAAGTCTLTGGATQGSTVVQLSHLPPSYRALVGDHVSVNYASGLRSLHKVLEDATGNTSGVLAGLVIDPPLRASPLTTADQVQLVRPSCVMVLMDYDTAGMGRAPVTFKAMQVLP